MYTSTVKDLGSKLPVGIMHNGKLQRELELVPIKAKVDRVMAEWKEREAESKLPGQVIAGAVPKLLSLVVRRVGEKTYPAVEDASTELEFHKWYYADALYAYVQARIQNLGPDVVGPVVCPHGRMGKCGFQSPSAVFDLSSADVVVADNLEELSRWVDLQQPFILSDGKTTVRSLKISPLLWSTLERPGVIGGPESVIDLATFQDIVAGINGKDEVVSLTEQDLDEMGQLDFKRINYIANEMLPGVDLRVTMICPDCGSPIVNPLQWDYDYFFGRSIPAVLLSS